MQQQLIYEIVIENIFLQKRKPQFLDHIRKGDKKMKDVAEEDIKLMLLIRLQYVA